MLSAFMSTRTLTEPPRSRESSLALASTHTIFVVPVLCSLTLFIRSIVSRRSHERPRTYGSLPLYASSPFSLVSWAGLPNIFCDFRHKSPALTSSHFVVFSVCFNSELLSSHLVTRCSHRLLNRLLLGVSPCLICSRAAVFCGPFCLF